MAIEQKIVQIREQFTPEGSKKIEGILNQLGDEGWELRDVFTSAAPVYASTDTRVYSIKDDSLLFRRVENKLQYRCRYIKRDGYRLSDLEGMNAEISKLNQEGFELANIINTSVLHPTQQLGITASILIFRSQE